MSNKRIFIASEAKFMGIFRIYLLISDGQATIQREKAPKNSNSQEPGEIKEILAKFRFEDVSAITDSLHPKDSFGMNTRALSIELIDGSRLDFDFQIFEKDVREVKQVLLPGFVAEVSFPTARFGTGIVHLKVEETGLKIEFQEDAKVAITGTPNLSGGLYSSTYPLEASIGFQVQQTSGSIEEHSATQSQVRISAVALFPVLPAASILIPNKKIEVKWETDDRTFDLKMSGNNWQFMCGVDASFFEELVDFGKELNKAVIKFGKTDEMKATEKPLGDSTSALEELEKASQMLSLGLINQAEFEELKRRILGTPKL